jgi:hypothetical protein
MCFSLSFFYTLHLFCLFLFCFVRVTSIPRTYMFNVLQSIISISINIQYTLCNALCIMFFFFVYLAVFLHTFWVCVIEIVIFTWRFIVDRGLIYIRITITLTITLSLKRSIMNIISNTPISII